MPAPPLSNSIRRLRPSRRRFFGLLLCSLALGLVFWQAPIVPRDSGTVTELRGVWMTDIGAVLLYYTTRLDEAIAHLAKLQLNTLYPSVWNGGTTLHPSAIAGASSGTHPLWQKLPRPDPLAGLLKQAHRQQLRLIPWFEYGLMIPPQSAIAIAHPDWLSTTRDGKHQDAANRQAWLNPAHPAVQQFLCDLLVEVAKRYAIDGIQLDDHFGLPVAFGYDAYTIQRYQAEHGGQAPPADPTDTEWMAWRAAHLTNLMKKIADSVRAVRPSAILSLSPNLPEFAYQNYLQDWPRWVELGLLDEVVVQVYRSQPSAFAAELSNARVQQLQPQVPIAIGIYTGPFLAPKPVEQIQQQVERVRQTPYSGVSFFCWETTFWRLRRPSGEGDRVLQASAV
ncbi:family 10 glycosylhydrolase [Phormidium tenue FACHB-886]|nr:family 10 glycosylhydrolase [Phormidium tenue FACHB-886]